MPPSRDLLVAFNPVPPELSVEPRASGVLALPLCLRPFPLRDHDFPQLPQCLHCVGELLLCFCGVGVLRAAMQGVRRQLCLTCEPKQFPIARRVDYSINQTAHLHSGYRVRFDSQCAHGFRALSFCGVGVC